MPYTSLGLGIGLPLINSTGADDSSSDFYGTEDLNFFSTEDGDFWILE